MKDIDTEARIAAVLQGDYLATKFPDVWFAQRAREEQNLKTALQRMNEELYDKFLKINQRKSL